MKKDEELEGCIKGWEQTKNTSGGVWIRGKKKGILILFCDQVEIAFHITFYQ